MRHRVSTACTNAPLLPMSGRHFEIDLIWRHFWKIMAPFFFFFHHFSPPFFQVPPPTSPRLSEFNHSEIESIDSTKPIH